MTSTRSNGTGPRLVALQTAVLGAAADDDLDTVIAYHSRTLEAQVCANAAGGPRLDPVRGAGHDPQQGALGHPLLDGLLQHLA
ncbi:hypothetical protein [Embleya sp. NPDC020886]|uniref:hypothetical protein n=1 Tax=Embleya sp. NPDC020886 TaxID=3363980 RepID=UPI0037B8E976